MCLTCHLCELCRDEREQCGVEWAVRLCGARASACVVSVHLHASRASCVDPRSVDVGSWPETALSARIPLSLVSLSNVGPCASRLALGCGLSCGVWRGVTT